MKFLKEKFYDTKTNFIDSFLDNGKENALLRLESNPGIPGSAKKAFVENFILELQAREVINSHTLDAVDDNNAWSIDFPGWFGSFNEEEGKEVFIIGSEPHIHHKYLQTVYGFNNENSLEDYLEHGHPIFRFIAASLSRRMGISGDEVLKKCYLTDLFPLSPFRGNGKSVGSTQSIQSLIGKGGNWVEIRRRYARQSLPSEIEGVKPELIITQGKAVFEEVKRILNIRETKIPQPIAPKNGGRKQYLRKAQWKDVPIISVPHIGSRRMRAFWVNNLEEVQGRLSEM